MSKQPYVVVVGSTMIDMVAYTKKVPSAGETVIGDSFALGFGGKGANQAVMARRLNATVSMVNTLGDDGHLTCTQERRPHLGLMQKPLPNVNGVLAISQRDRQRGE